MCITRSAPSSRSPLTLHDALPILTGPGGLMIRESPTRASTGRTTVQPLSGRSARLEEHTSELQSRFDLVFRLLFEKKKVSDDHHTGYADVTDAVGRTAYDDAM